MQLGKIITIHLWLQPCFSNHVKKHRDMELAYFFYVLPFMQPSIPVLSKPAVWSFPHMQTYWLLHCFVFSGEDCLSKHMKMAQTRDYFMMLAIQVNPNTCFVGSPSLHHLDSLPFSNASLYLLVTYHNKSCCLCCKSLFTLREIERCAMETIYLIKS